MSLAFVFDEHLRGPLWQAVLRHNLSGAEFLLDAVRVGDFPDLPLSANDRTILMWAEREARLLVTEDRHTMLVHLRDHLAEGHHSSGVLIPRAGERMQTLIESLVLIAHAGEPAEFADTIIYFP
jgi:hypothetical protein